MEPEQLYRGKRGVGYHDVLHLMEGQNQFKQFS